MKTGLLQNVFWKRMKRMIFPYITAYVSAYKPAAFKSLGRLDTDLTAP
jgi:hypothetical protein